MKKVWFVAGGLFALAGAANAAVDQLKITARVTDFWTTELLRPETTPAWLKSPKVLVLSFALDGDSLFVGELGFGYNAKGLGNLAIDGTRFDASFLYCSLDKIFGPDGREAAALSGGGALPELGPDGFLQYLSYNLENSVAANFDFEHGFSRPVGTGDFDGGGQLVLAGFEPNEFQAAYQITATIESISIFEAPPGPVAVPEPTTFAAAGASLLAVMVVTKRLGSAAKSDAREPRGVNAPTDWERGARARVWPQGDGALP
jgi:hypothetical protein